MSTADPTNAPPPGEKPHGWTPARRAAHRPTTEPAAPAMNIWTCKIGETGRALPYGADLPMRRAVEAAYREITGDEPTFLFSGWGGELTDAERAVVENRVPEYVAAAEPSGTPLNDEQGMLKLIAALVEVAGGAVTIPRSLMESMDRGTTLQRFVNPETMAVTYQVHRSDDPYDDRSTEDNWRSFLGPLYPDAGR